MRPNHAGVCGPRRRLRSVVTAAALAVAALVSTGNVRASSTVTGSTTFVPTYDGSVGASASAHGVNDAGATVGNTSVYTFVSNPPSATSYNSGVAQRWDAQTGASITLPGSPNDTQLGAQANATWINRAGVSVGSVPGTDAPAGSRPYVVAVRWAADGTLTHLDGLPTPPGTTASSTAGAIDVAGNVYGVAAHYDAASAAYVPSFVRWDAGSTTPTSLTLPANTYLGPPSVQWSVAGVSDAGDMIGTLSPIHGFLWRAGQTDGVLLDTPSHFEEARAISADGSLIAGIENVPVGNGSTFASLAVRWDNAGHCVVLDPVSVSHSGAFTYSVTSALGINNAGTIVGSGYDYAASKQIPVRWDAGGTAFTRLQGLGTRAAGVASAINALGSIAGGISGAAAGDPGSAVIWPAGSVTPIDLNTLLASNSGWTLTGATAISDTGFVSGGGLYLAGDGSAAVHRGFTILVPQAGTYGLGDANFDTHVDFADLLVLAKHYGQPSGGAIDAGDLDLNGTTDFGDLLTLAKHYGASPVSVMAATNDDAFSADWALAQSLVPEPGATALMILAFVRPRRRV